MENEGCESPTTLKGDGSLPLSCFSISESRFYDLLLCVLLAIHLFCVRRLETWDLQVRIFVHDVFGRNLSFPIGDLGGCPALEAALVAKSAV